MNQHIDQSELSKIVARQRGADQEIVNVVVQQLFKNIEEKLITDSSVKIKELGLFRIIKSGSTQRILFFGNTVRNRTDATEAMPTPTTSGKPESTETVGNNDSVQQHSETLPASTDKSRSVPDEKPSGGVINHRNNNTASPTFRSDSAPQARNRTDTDRMLLAPQKNKTPVYIGVGILMALIIGTLIYNWISPSSKADNQLTYTESSAGTEEKRVARFAEVTNTDIENLSCIIIVDKNISLKELAKLYYGNELFWPYIYKANRNITDNSFHITSNSIVKIPRLTVDLVDYSTGILNGKIKTLGDQILKEAGALEE
ncbi:HU family DNA-binding protein [Dysgonomonas sp. OttesenSCG-928-M03]|nr:HU family DNA-binding protein [Dysgonomonas sp. OttesenSCG-928-M03]